MSVTVRLFYPRAQREIGNREEIEAEGATVGECLDDLVRRYAGLEKLIFNENGKLLEPVYVYINAESVAKADLAAPLRAGDTLIVAFLVTGG